MTGSVVVDNTTRDQEREEGWREAPRRPACTWGWNGESSRQTSRGLHSGAHDSRRDGAGHSGRQPVIGHQSSGQGQRLMKAEARGPAMRRCPPKTSGVQRGWSGGDTEVCGSGAKSLSKSAELVRAMAGYIEAGGYNRHKKPDESFLRAAPNGTLGKEEDTAESVVGP